MATEEKDENLVDYKGALVPKDVHDALTRPWRGQKMSKENLKVLEFWTEQAVLEIPAHEEIRPTVKDNVDTILTLKADPTLKRKSAANGINVSKLLADVIKSMHASEGEKMTLAEKSAAK